MCARAAGVLPLSSNIRIAIRVGGLSEILGHTSFVPMANSLGKFEASMAWRNVVRGGGIAEPPISNQPASAPARVGASFSQKAARRTQVIRVCGDGFVLDQENRPAASEHESLCSFSLPRFR